MTSNILDKTVGSLVGLACGDAVGTTLEFKPKGTFNPIDDMVGGGPFDLMPGQWTDDTSMALCLAHSLLTKQDFDPVDQMNRYCDWFLNGYMSSNGTCFDIGITVRTSLLQYRRSKNPYSGSTDPYSAGNGSIMRLAPIAIYYRNDIEQAMNFAGLSSKTTHGCQECIESCRLLAAILITAFNAKSKKEVIEQSHLTFDAPKVVAISKGDYLNMDYQELTGSGYVIESLESALWCFYHSNDFKEAILLAANLGNDADTTAAICGQIAGAYYGVQNIPQHWRELLTDSEDIHHLAEKLTQK